MIHVLYGVAISALRNLGDTKHSSTMPNVATRFYVLKNWFCVIRPCLALQTNSSGEALGRNISKKKSESPSRNVNKGSS